MDITEFVVSSREKALLYGDYNTYRTQLARRLLNCRKKLRVVTRSRGKYNPKSNAVKADHIAQDINHVHLQLLTAERAYAQAMAMKAAHAANKRGISGHTRSHIVSRLDKAAKYAESLSAALQQHEDGATSTVQLEARAYAALMRGAALFEKQAWQSCLASYAVAWAVYRALSSSAPAATATSATSAASPKARVDVIRDLLTDTIEPSLRYAAYQLKMSRSKPIPIIAREALASSESEAQLVAAVDAIDPSVLHPTTAPDDGAGGADAAESAGAGGVVASTRTLVWRSRAVHIEDASIASAWAALDLAKARLEQTLGGGKSSSTSTAKKPGKKTAMQPRDMAAAYDEVLTVSQDAVDATKAAIDDLRSEGVPQSDASMQMLYVARTAATYEMISCRIGRNRVLTGPHDGADVQLLSSSSSPASSVPNAPSTAGKGKKRSSAAAAEAPGRVLARLKEKVVLYDGTLQSLESVKELPGVAADSTLFQQLDATAQYFTALKALAIARSHSIVGKSTNALALLKHGHAACAVAVPILASSADGTDTSAPAGEAKPPSSPVRSIHVSTADAQHLLGLLQSELLRNRALVDMERQLQQQYKSASAAASSGPALAENLAEYPAAPVDLDNIVAYPPRLDLVPVKPIFLDIAWNYIGYPNRAASSGQAAMNAPAAGGKAAQAAKQSEEQQQPQKRGWFGFGR